jgi:hypothetical protein
MEFKKCTRCGNFYISNSDVCPKCTAKDDLEFTNFKTYIEENGFENNLNTISNETGITTKNLDRFINYTNINTSNKSKNIKL